MTTELVERPLTPIEIKQRQVDHLRLLTEIDNYQSEIDEHRRCAKDAANEVARIQSREMELRRELRSGTCWETVHVEPRQKSLEFADTLVERPTDTESHACNPGISATTDEPDPETDPPGPAQVFGTEFDVEAELDDEDPLPQRHGEGSLLDAIELRHLVTCVRPKEFWPTVATVESWHPDVRADVQRWCRNEHVRASPIAGLPIPHASPMPNVLENIEIEKKGKRGARPLSNPPKKRRSAQQSP